MERSTVMVRDLMTADPITIGLDETLLDIQRIFRHRRFHHLIVLDKDRPVGVVSDRDLLENISPFIGSRFSERPQDVETLKKRVHQIMTRKLVTVQDSASAIQASFQMLRYRVSCLPVLDDQGLLVGVLTMRDLVRWAVRQRMGPDVTQ